MRPIGLLLFAVLVAAIVLSSCSGTQPTAPSPTQQPSTGREAASITIKDFKFSPAALIIKKGTTVTWTNEDSVSHDVVSDPKGNLGAGEIFKSPLFSKGETYSFTFNAAGEYKYHCGVHPSMRATVIVEE